MTRTIFILLALACPVVAHAGGVMESVYAATCRVAGGTGVVYKEDETPLYILTAGHVVTEARGEITAEFFGSGTVSPPLKTEVVWRVFSRRDPYKDLALL